jgi:hypothetical protein
LNTPQLIPKDNMLSAEYIFLYITLVLPVFTAGIFMAFRCFRLQRTTVFVVEPFMTIQTIHVTEPLAVAEAIDPVNYSDSIQIAEPL